MKVTLPLTHKYHHNPRLSAGQVGEYLFANATNRRRILREAKYPSTVVVIRYEDAKTAITTHLAGGSSENILEKKLQVLRRRFNEELESDYKRANLKLCIDAIESFQGHGAKMEVNRVKFLRPGMQSPRLRISGVSVSVSIDLRTERMDSSGAKLSGGAIFVFSKSSRAARNLPERCKTITLLIQEVLKDQIANDETLDPTLCMAIDVFGGIVYRAKSQQRQLYKTVQNSCGEAATMWPSIEPPPNYNGPAVPAT